MRQHRRWQLEPRAVCNESLHARFGGSHGVFQVFEHLRGHPTGSTGPRASASSSSIRAALTVLFTFPLSRLGSYQRSPMARRSVTKSSRTGAPASPRPATSAKYANRLSVALRPERLDRERRELPPFEAHRRKERTMSGSRFVAVPLRRRRGLLGPTWLSAEAHCLCQS